MSEPHQTRMHPIQCRCGALRGELTITAAANHGVCYCKDCRTYAFLLGSAGDFLDALGGTEVIATLPQNVRLTAGRDKLVCLSLSPRGALRWYASCCNTPVANTPRNFRLPYAGVVGACLQRANASIDESFGPVRMRVNTSAVQGRVSAMPVSTFIAILKLFSWLLPARLSGNYRQTPFFDATGTPIVAVRVVSLEERKTALQAAVRALSAGIAP